VSVVLGIVTFPILNSFCLFLAISEVMNKYNSASKVTPNSPESGFPVQTAIVIAWFLSESVLQCHFLHVPGMFHL